VKNKSKAQDWLKKKKKELGKEEYSKAVVKFKPPKDTSGNEKITKVGNKIVLQLPARMSVEEYLKEYKFMKEKKIPLPKLKAVISEQGQKRAISLEKCTELKPEMIPEKTPELLKLANQALKKDVMIDTGSIYNFGISNGKVVLLDYTFSHKPYHKWPKGKEYFKNKKEWQKVGQDLIVEFGMRLVQNAPREQQAKVEQEVRAFIKKQGWKYSQEELLGLYEAAMY